MKVLGIETSCDETAVCLIEADGVFGEKFEFKILGNALVSQAALHAQFGGVFPNIAKREHAKNLVPLLERALQEADLLSPRPGLAAARPGLDAILAREPELYERLNEFLKRYEKPDIDAIAVTYGPGLEPALWVGINLARALSTVWNVPIVGVNHMEGHVILSMMDKDRLSLFDFPVLALLISGGHTELVLSKSFGEYDLIGQTRDDAVGEAFDKVARLLGLPYPGGPEISRLALLSREQNISADFKLPRPMIHEDNFDFSFSGLKTAVRRIVESHQGPTLENSLRSDLKMQIAREFEDSVADVLVGKTLRAVDAYGANTVLLGGGVSANTHIRLRLAETLKDTGNIATLLIPPPELATDNAIMIALAGYFHALNRDFVNPDMLKANGNLRLETKT